MKAGLGFLLLLVAAPLTAQAGKIAPSDILCANGDGIRVPMTVNSDGSYSAAITPSLKVTFTQSLSTGNNHFSFEVDSNGLILWTFRNPPSKILPGQDLDDFTMLVQGNNGNPFICGVDLSIASEQTLSKD